MKVELTVPTSWSELSHQQLEYFSRLIISGVNEVEILTRCFIRFAGLKLLHKDPVLIDGQLFYLFKKIKGSRFLLDVDLFTSMVSKLDFLLNEVKIFANPEQIGRYHGCNALLYGVTAEEYFLADAFYSDFSANKDEVSLNKLMAIFYRRQGETWENGIHLDKWMRRFKRIPLHRKYIIYLWYTGVKSWLIDKYPYVFSGSDSSPVTTPADELVMGLISSLNDGNIANNPQIKATEIHEVIFELNKRVETAQSI